MRNFYLHKNLEKPSEVRIMTKKILFGILALLAIVISLLALSRYVAPTIGPEKDFCCGRFSESKGTIEYFWSDDSNCGIPEEVSCAGSCPTVRDKKFCR